MATVMTVPKWYSPVSQWRDRKWFLKKKYFLTKYSHSTLKWKIQEMFGLLSIWNTSLNTAGYSHFLIKMEGRNVLLTFPINLQSLTKSTLSSANQWKHLRNSNNVKRATKRGEKSSRKTVKARHVSVTAYHERSIRCWRWKKKRGKWSEHATVQNDQKSGDGGGDR